MFKFVMPTEPPVRGSLIVVMGHLETLLRRQPDHRRGIDSDLDPKLR